MRICPRRSSDGSFRLALHEAHTYRYAIGSVPAGPFDSWYPPGSNDYFDPSIAQPIADGYTDDGLVRSIVESLLQTVTLDDVQQFAYRMYWPISTRLGVIGQQSVQAAYAALDNDPARAWKVPTFFAALPPPMEAVDEFNCATKDMYPNGTDGMVFDTTGCRQDPTSGQRMPNDCGDSAKGERRLLCPGVEEPWGGTSAIANLFKSAMIVAKMTMALVPGLGTTIAASFSPIFDSLVSTLTDNLNLGDPSELAQSIEDAIQDVMETVKDYTAQIESEVEKTFHEAIDQVIKTIVSAVQTTVSIDLASLPVTTQVSLASETTAAYAALQSGLKMAAIMLGQDPAGVDKLLALADPGQLLTLKNARGWLAGRQSLGTIATAVNFAEAQGCSSSDANCINSTLANMTASAGGDITKMTDDQLAVVLNKSHQVLGMDAAQSYVSSYMNKPNDLMATWASSQLDTLIQDPTKRAAYKTNHARSMIKWPYVTAAVQNAETMLNQARGIARKMLGGYVKNGVFIVDLTTPGAQGRQKQAAAYLAKAQADADAYVASMDAQANAAIAAANRSVISTLAPYKPKNLLDQILYIAETWLREIA